MVKGLKLEDEMEKTDLDKSRNKSRVTNLDKSWNESETANSVQQMDSEKLDSLKAKDTRMQRKSMPSRRVIAVKELRWAY